MIDPDVHLQILSQIQEYESLSATFGDLEPGSGVILDAIAELRGTYDYHTVLCEEIAACGQSYQQMRGALSQVLSVRLEKLRTLHYLKSI